MKIDLHLHSTASDGGLSPEELVRLAANKGLSVIAIADHDSVEGIEPALLTARDFPPLRVIPAVEISSDIPQNEVHVLGYFIDYHNLELKETLERLRNSRKIRAKRMLFKLANLGIHIDWERVQELAGEGAVGRPHIAQAIFERGYVSSPKEAFIRYIGRNGPAYVEREKMTPAEAVELIVKAGGLPILGHPANIDNLEEFIPQLQEVGLVGLEAYYDNYPLNVKRYLASLARKYGLIATGGSDFHGIEGSNETPLGEVDVPYECLEKLLKIAQQHSLLTI